MKRLAVIIGLAALVSGCGSNENEAKKEEASAENTKADDGWITLFDGKTLDGWHGYGKGDLNGRWKIYDSTLVLDTTIKLNPAPTGNLISNEEYDNFHLKLDWKISEAGNSGILFYVHEDTTQFKEPYFTGPEMQVVDNVGHPDGKLVKHQAGDLYDLIASSTKAAKPVGEWNHAEIISNNGKLDLRLNDTTVVSTTLWDDNWKQLVAGSKFKAWPSFATYKKGAICLQDHGNVVSYKNIMIKKL
jgi:antitoxin component YwqK of YwqJK toxin-antitoxin module